MKKTGLILLLGLLLTNVNIHIIKPNNNENNINDTESNEKIKNRDKKYSEYLDNTYLTNDATYYYYNLTENYPKNYKGTCAYVAISMLLQYYDTFWDDNIIPPKYDVSPTNTISINERTSSPGVMADKIPTYSDERATQLTNSQYYDLIMNMTSMYFQPYLLKIADGLGLVGMPSEDCLATLNTAGIEYFIDYYLQNYVGYSVDDFTITVVNENLYYSKVEETREFIIEKLLQKIPVVVSIEKNGEWHACIAYDYDSSTGDIYVHYGDYENHKHYKTTKLDTIYVSAVTLEIHKSHYHSNNYGLVTNGNVTYHCGCELATHKHKYTHSYAQYNAEYHIEYCHCGASKQNLHECTGLYGRYEACIHCGTIVDLWTTGTNSVILPKKEDEVM